MDDTGKMKIDLVYEDVSQMSPVDKRSFWESKYLGIRSE
ncbi:immunity protein YezG family protein [Shouchella lehensis]|nr:immunity protein YezG family protein [Shouchella lehensis]